ncbi:hypothetical protein EA472_20895 [Natrarchaeobius oligotrophus]|uniref:Uncharacterized protein n=1 Tax=Natrarchaeobius chitinivorans TaxID=1679083 RepID=A0A3N6M2X6_NATCH|nr:hypothetical protein EA472_20895 [Natrarchaeobius chitinivorans]
MTRRIIQQTIVRDAVGAKLTVFDYRFHALCTQFLAKQPSVVAFVGGQKFQLIEFSFEHLLADLGVIGLFHQSMYVESHTQYFTKQLDDADLVVRPSAK